MAENQELSNPPPPPYSDHKNPNVGFSPGQSSGYPGQSSGYPGQSSGYPGQSSGYPNVSVSQHNAPIYNQPVIVTQPVQSVVRVEDNFSLAVFAAICCFWPLGIIAVMRASESRSALARGNVQAAIIASSDSRRYSLISICIGVVALIIIIIAVVLLVSVSR